jgi:hypothetical protein
MDTIVEKQYITDYLSLDPETESVNVGCDVQRVCGGMGQGVWVILDHDPPIAACPRCMRWWERAEVP